MVGVSIERSNRFDSCFKLLFIQNFRGCYLYWFSFLFNCVFFVSIVAILSNNLSVERFVCVEEFPNKTSYLFRFLCLNLESSRKPKNFKNDPSGFSNPYLTVTRAVTPSIKTSTNFSTLSKEDFVEKSSVFSLRHRFFSPKKAKSVNIIVSYGIWTQFPPYQQDWKLRSRAHFKIITIIEEDSIEKSCFLVFAAEFC